jgi:hypothetical protein
MPQGLVKPANSILVAGVPIIVEYEIGANATAAQMIAGRLVIFDNLDYSVKEAGDEADDVVGVLMEQPDELEATAYEVADQAKVIVGPMGVIVKLLLITGENVTRGANLVAAANGKVKALAVGTMGSQGSPIGRAMESVDASAADAEIMVRLNLEAEPLAQA